MEYRMGLLRGVDMRLSNHEEEFFKRLKVVNLSARDRAEIRLRSPRLADAIAEYQQKHIPNRPYVSDIKNIIPGLHPHQAKAQEQTAALQRMGYSLDLESLKVNNPWEANHLPAHVNSRANSPPMGRYSQKPSPRKTANSGRSCRYPLRRRLILRPENNHQKTLP
jgi:hypothetical protein